MDAKLNYIKNNVTQMILLDAAPATRQNAIDNALATITLPGTDITLANGDVSGRKLVCAAKLGETVSQTGTFNHIALISGSELLLVTEAVTPKNLNATDTVDVVTWDFEDRDPTAA